MSREIASSPTAKAFQHGKSVAIDVPDAFGLKPGDEVVLDQDDAGVISMRKAAPREPLSHFVTAATKLSARQKKETQAWAAQLERDREVQRKASRAADRVFALQKAELEKAPAKKWVATVTKTRKVAAPKKKAKRRS